MLGLILVVFLGVVFYQWRWRKGLIIDEVQGPGREELGATQAQGGGKDGDRDGDESSGSSGLSTLSRSEEGSMKVEEFDKEKETENEGGGVKVLG